MDIVLLKIITLGFFIFDLLLGLACIAIGLWFHASQDIHAYMTVFVRGENDRTVVAAAGILLAVGFILSALTIAVILGIILNKHFLIRIFILLGWIVSVLGLICGFMIVGFRHDIHRFVRDGMTAQLQNQYAHEGRVGLAWNRVQVKKRCCGVEGSWDYRGSDWYASVNSNMGVVVDSYVPDSCCVLNFNQDRELYWVDPQNLQLKDKLRCNQDAEGYKSTSANVHSKGCFAALFAKNQDLWHDQDIFLVMDLISGLGLSAGFLQIFAVILAMFYSKELKRDEEGKKRPPVGRY